MLCWCRGVRWLSSRYYTNPVWLGLLKGFLDLSWHILAAGGQFCTAISLSSCCGLSGFLHVESMSTNLRTYVSCTLGFELQLSCVSVCLSACLPELIRGLALVDVYPKALAASSGTLFTKAFSLKLLGQKVSYGTKPAQVRHFFHVAMLRVYFSVFTVCIISHLYTLAVLVR